MGANYSSDGDGQDLPSAGGVGVGQEAGFDATGNLDVIEIAGAIKWFDVAKGFGFIVPDDGKADVLLAERMRVALADALAPIWGVLAEPLGKVRVVVDEVRHAVTLYEDNARLRAENDTLRRWQSVALALDAENAVLKANLRWVPDPTPSYVTARVVADAGGVYARAVLLSLGPNHHTTKGQIALDERGLVGRVTEIGSRSARVLLITDLNSVAGRCWPAPTVRGRG